MADSVRRIYNRIVIKIAGSEMSGIRKHSEEGDLLEKGVSAERCSTSVLGVDVLG